jgi:hypothetical protein
VNDLNLNGGFNKVSSKMEPLQKILELYKDKEGPLLHYLPEKTRVKLSGYRYRSPEEPIYLGERVILVSKNTGEAQGGKVICNRDKNLTISFKKLNRRYPIQSHYIFVKPKINKRSSDTREFMKALLRSLE